MRTPIRLAIGVGLLLVAAGLAYALLGGERPFLADNGRDIELLRGVRLKPGERACQAGETVPAHAGNLRMTVNTGGRPAGPLEVTVATGGRVISRGRSSSGFVDERVRAQVDVHEGADPGTVCVRNAGTQKVTIFGQRASKPPFARIAGRPHAPRDAMRFEWFEGDAPARVSNASTVAERYGLVKPSLFGSWTFWFAMVLLVAISAAAIVLVAREARR